MKIATFINRRVISCVLSVFVIILGVIGLLRLPMEQFPKTAPPSVRLSATYTGANAENIEIPTGTLGADGENTFQSALKYRGRNTSERRS